MVRIHNQLFGWNRLLIYLNSFVYYPEESCRVFKNYFGHLLDTVCAPYTGGSSNAQSSARTTPSGSKTAATGTPATRTAASSTVPTGTGAARTTATGTAPAGPAATGTASAGTAATGSQQTQTPNSAASASALTPWEMLIGLIMLAINI